MSRLKALAVTDASAPLLRGKITQIVEPILAAHAFSLVNLHEVRRPGTHQIHLTLYRRDPFSIIDLEQMHKVLQPRLMVLLGHQDISLALSSPGINYTFKHESDYDIFAGNMVRILSKKDNRWHIGELTGRRGSRIFLRQSDGATTACDISDITKAKLNN